MTQLIVHIGDMKTGTTSIQRALIRQKWSGLQSSILFPRVDEQPNHHFFASALIREDHETVEKHLSKIRMQALESEADYAIISSELIEDANAERLLEAIEAYVPELANDLRVISYVRPHAERVMSSWAQVVKLGYFGGTVSEFYEKMKRRGKLPYAERFMPWQNALGSRFTLRPTVRSVLEQGDIVADFLSQVTGETNFEPEEDIGSHINETLSLQDLVLLRYFHNHRRGRPLEGTENARMRAGEYLSYILSAHRAAKSNLVPRMDRKLYEKIAAEMKDDAEALDDVFFENQLMSVALRSFAGRVVEDRQSMDVKDYFSKDQVRLVSALSVLLHDMIKIAPERLSSGLTDLVSATTETSVWEAKKIFEDAKNEPVTVARSTRFMKLRRLVKKSVIR